MVQMTMTEGVLVVECDTIKGQTSGHVAADHRLDAPPASHTIHA